MLRGWYDSVLLTGEYDNEEARAAAIFPEFHEIGNLIHPVRFPN
jgi:hypothetical protein